MLVEQPWELQLDVLLLKMKVKRIPVYLELSLLLTRSVLVFSLYLNVDKLGVLRKL